MVVVVVLVVVVVVVGPPTKTLDVPRMSILLFSGPILAWS